MKKVFIAISLLLLSSGSRLAAQTIMDSNTAYKEFVRLANEDTDKVLKENKTYDTWQSGFLAVFTLAKNDKAFIDNIYKSVSLEMLEQYLYRLVYPLIKSVVDEKAKNYKVRDDEKGYIADFYKYAFVGELLDWIRNDMRESPEEIVEKISKIMGGNVERALHNFMER